MSVGGAHHGAFDYFEGVHDGYAPLEHRRHVLTLRGDLLVVADLVRRPGRAYGRGALARRSTLARDTCADTAVTFATSAAQCQLVVPHGDVECFTADARNRVSAGTRRCTAASSPIDVAPRHISRRVAALDGQRLRPDPDNAVVDAEFLPVSRPLERSSTRWPPNRRARRRFRGARRTTPGHDGAIWRFGRIRDGRAHAVLPRRRTAGSATVCCSTVRDAHDSAEPGWHSRCRTASRNPRRPAGPAVCTGSVRHSTMCGIAGFVESSTFGSPLRPGLGARARPPDVPGHPPPRTRR